MTEIVGNDLAVNLCMFITPILRDYIDCMWPALKFDMKKEKSHNRNSLIRAKKSKHNLFDQLTKDYSIHVYDK